MGRKKKSFEYSCCSPEEKDSLDRDYVEYFDRGKEKARSRREVNKQFKNCKFEREDWME